MSLLIVVTFKKIKVRFRNRLIVQINRTARRLSENGFVGRLSDRFGGKAERTKTPEA